MSAFDLSQLSSALPPSRTAAQQAEYEGLRQRVQSMAYGYRGPPSGQRGANFYAVWEGREVGIFANWDLCSASVIGYPRNGYQKMRSWDQAVDAVTDYMWAKHNGLSNTASTGPLPSIPQPRAVDPTPSLPSPSTPSSVSRSTHPSFRTPSSTPSTPTRARAPANPTRTTPTARPLPPSDTQTFYIVAGRHSTLFFIDSDEAKEAAFDLQQRGELEDFCSTPKLLDALERLNLAANVAAAGTDGL